MHIFRKDLASKIFVGVGTIIVADIIYIAFFFFFSIPVKEKYVKAPNILERAKEEIEAIIHHDKSPRHTKETHGTSNDIDENTPIEEVKGPGVIQRVKEEIEALVEAVHPKKKDSSSHDSSSK